MAELPRIGREFKYLAPASYQKYGTYSLDSFHFGGMAGSAEFDKNKVSTEGNGLSDFFTDYIEHSKQLVNALLTWVDKLEFASCRYENGNLDTFPTTQPEVPYMDMMVEHMKSAYPQILDEYGKIDAKRKRLCNDIQIALTRTTFVVPDKPSFQRLITDKIESSCPRLRKSDDYEFKTTSIYLANRIFARLFLIISDRRSKIELNIDDSTFPDNRILLIQRTHAIAQGRPEDMIKLKNIIERLVIDEEVIERVNRYIELHKQLTNDEDIESFRHMVRKLHEIVHGGKGRELNGLGTCDLCRPYSSSLNN